MSISQALGISEDKMFKKIPEDRIKHVGNSEIDTVEACTLYILSVDDIKADIKGIKNMGIEITGDVLKKYAKNLN